MSDPEKTPPWRRQVQPALFGVAAIAAAGFAATIWAWRAGRLDTIDMASLLILCGVICAVALGTALTYTPGPIRGGLLPGSRERSLSWTLINNVALGLFWIGTGTTRAVEAFAGQENLRGYSYVILVLLWLYVSPATLMGWIRRKKKDGPDPDEELNSVFRARATASGFWALLAVGAAAWLISLTRPDILLYALPFGLWLGGSIACVHFVWLHRRADLGDEDNG